MFLMSSPPGLQGKCITVVYYSYNYLSMQSVFSPRFLTSLLIKGWKCFLKTPFIVPATYFSILFVVWNIGEISSWGSDCREWTLGDDRHLGQLNVFRIHIYIDLQEKYFGCCRGRNVILYKSTSRCWITWIFPLFLSRISDEKPFEVPDSRRST